MVKLILPRIKVNASVRIIFPSTFVADGAQTIEYEESIKDVEECVACKAIINQDVGTEHVRWRVHLHLEECEAGDSWPNHLREREREHVRRS